MKLQAHGTYDWRENAVSPRGSANTARTLHGLDFGAASFPFPPVVQLVDDDG